MSQGFHHHLARHPPKPAEKNARSTFRQHPLFCSKTAGQRTQCLPFEIHTARWTGDRSVTGFSCHQGQYCEDVASGTMTDYAHSGNEDIKACAALCTASKSCKFIPSCTFIVKRNLYTIHRCIVEQCAAPAAKFA